ncbi:MAG: heterodisulfide reductase-related iron-sulfur binding cluster [bacterium]
MATGSREGSLEAPTRHSLDWKNPDFYNEDSLNAELERVFDICHGCRRCVSLCNSFPTLFDLVDESDTMEVDGVDKKDYMKVVDHCYLCDLCYLTKCPYVPPHEWNVDYPHLMLRAKAVKYKKEGASTRDKLLSSTDLVGKLAGIPVVSQAVNAANSNATMRKGLEKVLGVHHDAVVPEYHSSTARKRLASHTSPVPQAQPAGRTTGKVAVFATCYGNYNKPDMVEDLVAVLEHNDIPVTLVDKEKCCGMPKLELGDLEAVAEAKDANIPAMVKMIDAGWDIVGPVPSCVLMFKQELPLMFPDDADVLKVRDHIFDPFEYLMLREKDGLLKTEFPKSLGKVSYHAACHLRVQKIGLKTRDLLKKIPDTTVEVHERCSGHDGTYAVKKEFHDISMKICRPVYNKVKSSQPDHYSSDCPMAGEQIQHGVNDGSEAEHPLKLLRMAYGI